MISTADGEVSALLSGAIPVEKDPGKCLAIDIDIERGKKRLVLQCSLC